MSYDLGQVSLVDTPKCGKCVHWFPVPKDPNNLAAPRNGECRESLRATAIMMGGGNLGFIPFYPVIPETMSACSHYGNRSEVVT